MNKATLRLLLLLVGIAALLGATHRQLLDYLAGEDELAGLPEGQPAVVVPESGIRTDAFSLSLFREALDAGAGNVCVAPAAMAELLRRLHAVGGDATRELIAQQLPAVAEEGEPTAARPQLFCRLFVDDSLPFAPEASPETALRVPLRHDFTRALALVNAIAGETTEGFADHMLDGRDISKGTRLLALCAARFQRPWLRPFHPLGPRDGRDFHYADGSIRPTRMMACCDALCAARAADGSWEAVALFFLNEGRKGAPACFVGILPAPGADAREFARELTPGHLSDIRRALALAAPRELTVTLPMMQLDSVAIDLEPLMLRLGLGRLFTQSADFSRLAGGGLHLDMALGKYAFFLEAQPGSPAAPAGEAIRFDRPFIWFIGDLTTANPPCFMGLMEKP